MVLRVLDAASEEGSPVLTHLLGPADLLHWLFSAPAYVADAPHSAASLSGGCCRCSPLPQLMTKDCLLCLLLEKIVKAGEIWQTSDAPARLLFFRGGPDVPRSSQVGTVNPPLMRAISPLVGLLSSRCRRGSGCCAKAGSSLQKGPKSKALATCVRSAASGVAQLFSLVTRHEKWGKGKNGNGLLA